ncbi:methylated-DNA--[protein]-cysteine S-methyltransferase [Brevibacterium sp.]|uniref:methylated-DNA--[protein]-cysteine S-methyltransferase n=1 Tax=Brevibacterium sp. TaxID=1701 RepID=UPI0028114FDA|nr:methylated-DNA--[protein]-cysteine S-methyltransferase [Brevibacterium sp.]
MATTRITDQDTTAALAQRAAEPAMTFVDPRPGTLVHTTIDSPLGRLLLTSDGQSLTGLHLGDFERVLEYAQLKTGAKAEEADDHEVFRRTTAQLGEYFAGSRRVFDLPLAPSGTEFQQAVWQALTTIPYGSTAGYGELAGWLGRPLAARAVGGANGKNPISIIVPCHRVIGANGTMTGYAWGENSKHDLLELEAGRRSF